jgi:hypothetical protein
VGATYVGRDKLREPPVLAKTCELTDRELSRKPGGRDHVVGLAELEADRRRLLVRAGVTSRPLAEHPACEQLKQESFSTNGILGINVHRDIEDIEARSMQLSGDSREESGIENALVGQGGVWNPEHREGAGVARRGAKGDAHLAGREVEGELAYLTLAGLVTPPDQGKVGWKNVRNGL